MISRVDLQMMMANWSLAMKAKDAVVEKWVRDKDTAGGESIYNSQAYQDAQETVNRHMDAIWQEYERAGNKYQA